MTKRSLGVLAVVLIALMVIVAVAGLDRLPRDVRSSIEATSTRVQTDRTRFDEARSAVQRAVSREPDLFRSQAAAWQIRLAQADNRLKQAEAELLQLRQLENANQRDDAPRAQEEIRKIESLRSGAVQDALNLRAEADRWIGYKQNLPARLASMQSSWNALHAFDIGQQASAVQKAVTDWPAKREDLQTRIGRLQRLKDQGEEAWAASSDARAKATARDDSAVDYSTLFASGEAIDADLRELQRGMETLTALAGQLYVSRDKILLSLDDDKGTRQQVRVVETQYADAALTNPKSTSKEEWENVDEKRFHQLKKNIGMVVERKAAGRYDSEAEKNIQPPAYAYVAPPGQANQYGSWQNGVWQWLPQYLILSQLLRTSSYPTISTGDYYGYDQARRRGDVWYGRSGQYGGTWSRQSGTYSQGGGTVSSGSTRPREGWNTGGSTYGGSKYQSRGTYGGSRYQSRPGGSGGGFGSRSYSRGTFSRGFGRGGRR